MRAEGYLPVRRGVLDDPLFAGEAFCRRAAWLWLIEHAAFADTTIDQAGAQVDVRRGELVATQRQLAQAWGWGRHRVRSFLEELAQAGRIIPRPHRGPLSGPGNCSDSRILTICNYEEICGGDLWIKSFHAQNAAHFRARNGAHKRKKDSIRDQKDKHASACLPQKGAHAAAPVVLDQPAQADLLGTATVIALPPDLCDVALAAWNRFAEGHETLRRVSALTQNQRVHMRSRLRELGGLEGWTQLLEEIPRSQWMLGLRGDRDGHTWVVTLGWLIRSAGNLKKVVDGEYRDRNSLRSSARQTVDMWDEVHERLQTFRKGGDS
jgi:hypothetical protein